MHHQGIDRVAPGFTVGARHVVSGLPEAIEAPDHPFCLGVQWHPETLAARDAAQQALFDALVAAARERVRPFPATGASRNDAPPAENVPPS